jgi:hypothetical protein
MSRQRELEEIKRLAEEELERIRRFCNPTKEERFIDELGAFARECPEGSEAQRLAQILIDHFES